MKTIMYLLVPFAQVKSVFPYARVLPDGRAVLELARIRQLHGVFPIEVATQHEVDMLINGESEEAPDEENNEEVENVETAQPEETQQAEPAAEEESNEPAENGESDPEPSDEGGDGEQSEEGENNEE